MEHPVTSVADLTTDWFNRALRDVLDGVRVVDAQVERIGTGQLARMARAVLIFDGPTGAPESVVVKYPSDDERSLGFAVGMSMYRLEVLFYREIAPLLPDFRAPACYFGDVDTDGGAFTLALEDLSGRTRPGDVLTRSTPDECSQALGQLVNLQAPTWDRQEIADLQWLADPGRTVALFDQLATSIDPFLERFGSQLDDEHVRVCESILPKAGQWARSWSSPTVLQHGDFRTDNLMFGEADGTPPITVIDFQLIRLGPPGFDVAYLLGSAIDTDVRRKVEADLIAEYHQRLVAAGVTGLDHDQCWRAYREGALAGVVMFCGAATSVESTERGDRMVVDQVRRYADLAIDLDAAGAAGI